MHHGVPATPVEKIPIVDLGPFLAGTAGARERLGAELVHIQEEIGFYYVVNHGVPMDVIARGFAQLARFFALPPEEKATLRMDHTSIGFLPARSTIYVTSPINQNTKKDLNEVLLLVNERPADHPGRQAGKRFLGPNKWPANLPGFRETIEACHAELAALGRRLLPLYATALGRTAEFFDPLFTDPTWTTRNAWYPPVEAEGNQFGISPHQDHGFLTVLPVSEVPGLQIRTRDGRWIPAQFVESGILVNTGEFLHRWTNGRFLATPHRVVPPARDRYSMALFFNPSPDTLADPRDFARPGEEIRFEPVRMHDYLCWYVDRNYLRGRGGQLEDQSPEHAGSSLTPGRT